MSTYIYKYSVEYSCYSERVAGRYYWTNVYFLGSDYNNFSADPSANYMRVATINAVSEAVTVERYRVERVSGAGAVAYDVVIPTPGNIPGAGRNLLHNACHVRAGQGVRGVWYKRLRGLLGAGDVAGGVVSSFIVEWLQTYYLPLLASVPLLNHNYNPVGAMVVSSRVHPWTLRHGTYRRQRTVLGAVI